MTVSSDLIWERNKNLNPAVSDDTAGFLFWEFDINAVPGLMPIQRRLFLQARIRDAPPDSL